MKQAAFWIVMGMLVLGTGCSADKTSASGEVPDGSVPVGDGGFAASGGSSGSGGSGGVTGSIGNSGTTGSNQDGGTDTIGVDPNWTIPEELQLCDGPCECADGIDNDNDGVADGFDPECTGPGDNDEGSFATGISGDNMDPKWQDCFFDGNSGGGDDGCMYSTKCLTGELPQTDKNCTLQAKCIDFCAARTPNGCDCFGCCEVFKGDGSSVHIVLSSACDEDDLSKCQTCTPSTQCGNTCGECELCPGKGPEDLPDSCSATPPGGTAGSGGSGGSGAGGSGGSTAGTGGTGGSTPPAYVCEGGGTVCERTSDCASGQYCAFGCCLPSGPD